MSFEKKKNQRLFITFIGCLEWAKREIAIRRAFCVVEFICDGLLGL